MTSNAAANRAAGNYTAEFTEIAVPDHFNEMARNCDLFISEDKTCGSESASDSGGPACIHVECTAVIASKLAPTGISLTSVGDQTTLATALGRGDSKLTSTKLTSATLRL